MEQFLENVNNYIETKGLKLKARIENKIIYKTLVLESESGEAKAFKIDDLRVIPPAIRSVCHSPTGFIKINPHNQTNEWLDNILKEAITTKNRIKLK